MALTRGTRDYRRYYWHCNVCDAQNSVEDGECQYCECEGVDCKRDNCSDPRHPFEKDDEDAPCLVCGEPSPAHTPGCMLAKEPA